MAKGGVGGRGNDGGSEKPQCPMSSLQVLTSPRTIAGLVGNPTLFCFYPLLYQGSGFFVFFLFLLNIVDSVEK